MGAFKRSLLDDMVEGLDHDLELGKSPMTLEPFKLEIISG